MKEGERFGRSFSTLEKQQNIALSNDTGLWSFRLPYDETIVLPERLGKVMALGISISEDAFIKRSELSFERLETFDCHHFVMLALGLRNISAVRETGIHSQEQIFSNDEFFEVKNAEHFDALASERIGSSHIGIFQMMKAGTLTHSSLLFKTDSNLYIAGKAGFKNLLFIDKSSEGIPGLLQAYGNTIAIDSYENVLNKYKPA
jgi:hypothetical protein